jgi:putative transposase
MVDIKLWKQLIDNGDWRQVLRAPEEELEFEGMRKHTMTGRPYGSEGFLKKLERRLDRRVRALPVGRPKTKRNRP